MKRIAALLLKGAARRHGPERDAAPHAAEDEYRRLKHIVAKQTLDIQALKAVVAQRGRPHRAAMGRLRAQGTSLRRACRLIGPSMSTWRYKRGPDPLNTQRPTRLTAHASDGLASAIGDCTRSSSVRDYRSLTSASTASIERRSSKCGVGVASA
jgi:hypothetical protein